MIDAIATRRVNLNGKTYEEGDKARMPLQQFEDLEPTGMFERAPAEKKVSAKAAKPADAKSDKSAD